MSKWNKDTFLAASKNECEPRICNIIVRLFIIKEVSILYYLKRFYNYKKLVLFFLSNGNGRILKSLISPLYVVL